MKLILSAWLMLLTVTANAQADKAVTNEELKALVGKWEGTAVVTDFTAGKNQLTLTTSLEVVDAKDSLIFNFTYTATNGKETTEKYPVRVYDNGSKISFDSAQYEIAEIRRRGVRLTIYAERSWHDENFRSADYQNTILIGPGILNITKGIRYSDMVDFSILNRMALTKK